MDNAPCHIITQEFSHITLVFFPANTSSKCQPLDQGIIKSFKCHYRQRLVRHVISQYTIARTADEISIHVLEAVRWIDLGWKTVTGLTIQNGIRTAGFLVSSTTFSSTDSLHVVNQYDS
jgi:hypothetical protein